jgi:gas vesicle protein
MSENPDDIRSEIEETRRRLGSNVDAVADKVTPSHVVRRQTEKVKDAVFGVKEKVMGAADELADGGRSAIDDAGAALGDVPHRLAGKTQGSPLAAGLIAFGAGLLVASLIPASEKEKEAAAALKEAAEPLTSELAAAAQDVAQDLQEPAQEALENVKSAASEAVENVKEESQTAVSDVTDSTTAARDRIQPA